jgi:hypothetical protein
MHVIIAIDADLKSRIDSVLTANKGYRDMDEFIRRAISNQLALEGSQASGPSSASAEGRPNTLSAAKLESSTALIGSASRADTKLRAVPIAASQRSVDTAMLTMPTRMPITVGLRPMLEVELKRPLWGQINRFGPCKLPLRVLSNLLVLSGDSWMDIKQVSATVSDQAPIIRDILEARDEAEQRKRGEELSAAFPKLEKASLQRFSNQYLGYYAAESNQPKGILADLSFVDIRKTAEGVVEIGLTEPGLEFSAIRSPLIDDIVVGNAPSKGPLSTEEVEFIVKHLMRYRPGEHEFLLEVLTRISEGSNTPTTLLTAVEEYFKNSATWPDASSAVVGTMRAGAVSKLVELGFIKIEKDGARSKYLPTGNPKHLMEAIK